MLTHTEIVSILKVEAKNIRNRCSVAELSLVTRRIEFEPVPQADFWVVFTKTPCTERLKVYLENLLAIKVGFLPKLETRIEYKIISKGPSINPGPFIRELVRLKGWTDEEFAKLIGIKREGLMRIYQGKSHPSKLQTRICDLLGVPSSVLYQSE